FRERGRHARGAIGSAGMIPNRVPGSGHDTPQSPVLRAPSRTELRDFCHRPDEFLVYLWNPRRGAHPVPVWDHMPGGPRPPATTTEARREFSATTFRDQACAGAPTGRVRPVQHHTTTR